MGRSHALQHEHRAQHSEEEWPQRLHDDPRWRLAQRVAAGSHFSRSALLSKFLLFVVAETIEGRASEITEHQIGVQVFDRRAGYSTVEDNIVRNYARQLRKRLAEYFAGEGGTEHLRIDIPLGGYVPVFVPVSIAGAAEGVPGHPVAVSGDTQECRVQTLPAILSPSNSKAWRWVIGATFLAVYSTVLIYGSWIAGARSTVAHRTPGAADGLWGALLQSRLNTYIVPADAGFNLLEDLSHSPEPLTGYIQGAYLKAPIEGIDAHSAEDLRSQRFTSFVDLEIATDLARLPEYDSQRVMVRFPRDLRLDDLKNANAVLIGSVGSNPWTSIADASANFRIVYGKGMKGATIINTHPAPGEASLYESHWNEPAHETFALIAFLPNLDGNGRLLLLQGLDVAGTEAAAETLFHPAAIAAILKRATRPDGSMRFFEILLRSTSIESNSAGTQVIASRIY